MSAVIRLEDLRRFWLARVALGLGRVKTIVRRGRIVVITERTEHLRRVAVLVARDFTASDESFWIPRRAADAKKFCRQRRTRKRFIVTRPATRRPVEVGEPRPLDAATVPVESVCLSLSFASWVQLVREVGYDPRAMPPRPCVSRYRPEPPVPRTRKELGEVITDQTPPSEMLPERLEQRRDHEKLMKVFQTARMGLFHQDTIYSVIVLGRAVKEVAESSGLNARSLAVAVSRIRARMS